MKIYVSHAKDWNYVDGLYLPLRASALNLEHEIILPHEKSGAPFNSKKLMKTFDLMIAEVSIPATGLGIEIGWADVYEIPILAAHKTGTKLSQSVQDTAQYFLEYANPEEFIGGIERILEREFKNR